jgi:ABC-type multidrug transport system ATPase subunit
MLGLSPRASRTRIDAVLDFAELREFADLKLKNYSSGMLVRLAFSVMIQVDAEVLIIDEVLAVGDAAFQQKCYDEFERIRRSGKTVLFVTHDMNAVRRFCDRAVLLEKGRLIAEGDPEDVGVRYLQLNFSAEARAAEREAAEAAASTSARPRRPSPRSSTATRAPRSATAARRSPRRGSRTRPARRSTRWPTASRRRSRCGCASPRTSRTRCSR